MEEGASYALPPEPWTDKEAIVHLSGGGRNQGKGTRCPSRFEGKPHRVAVINHVALHLKVLEYPGIPIEELLSELADGGFLSPSA
jgi:hypothetical protein